MAGLMVQLRQRTELEQALARRLDLLDPSPMDIEIEDIAHGLARVARWNGQTFGTRVFTARKGQKVGEDDQGNRYPVVYEIDEFRCIFCGFCEESCPVDSIVLTGVLEYHMETREESILTKDKLLALGDRFESEIAEARNKDAAYR